MKENKNKNAEECTSSATESTDTNAPYCTAKPTDDEVKSAEVAATAEQPLDDGLTLSPEDGAAISKPNGFKKLGAWIKDFFTYNIPGKRPRIWELDLLRGIILFVVTIDHIFVFGYYWNIFQFKTPVGEFFQTYIMKAYLESAFRRAVQPLGLWALSFMSGTTCQFSRGSKHRILKYGSLAAGFMLGYFILSFITPDYIVGKLIFNIIAVLAISIIFWYSLDLIKCPTWVRLALGFTLTFIGLAIFQYNYIHGGLDASHSNYYVDSPFFALFVYNGHGYEVSPNNFEPLLPHLGFFLLGGVFGRYFYADKTSRLKHKTPPKWLSPLLLLGKHSLEAFLLCPPVLVPVIWLIIKFIQLFV